LRGDGVRITITMGEDNLEGLLKTLRHLQSEISEDKERGIEELERRFEQEKQSLLNQQCDEQVEWEAKFEETSFNRVQHEVVRQLREKADSLSVLSKAFYKNRRNFEAKTSLDISLLYGNLYRERRHVIGIVTPTYNESYENGEGYLPNRLNGLVFEALLKAKEADLVEKITTIESSVANINLTIFEVTFSKKPLTIIDNEYAFSLYEEVKELEEKINGLFESDPVFIMAKVKLLSSEGAALNYLRAARLVDSSGHEAFDSEEQEVTKDYIRESKAIDLIFGINDPMKTGYEQEHMSAEFEFKDFMASGAFNKFDDFDGKSEDGTMWYDRARINSMIKGEEVVIGSSGGAVSYRLHYVARVEDYRGTLIFPCGALEEEDALTVYEVTKRKLGANFESEDGTNPLKGTKYEVITLDGKKHTLYPKEELDKMRAKKR
jgi:hypothetical protein